jgi:four helix bundle protein
MFLGYQVLKSGTAIGANYREANRAESRKDFIHKIGIVEKEASETQYWLELLDLSSIGSVTERQLLLRECNELLAIFTSIGKTAKSNLRKSKRETKHPNSQSAIANQKPAIQNPKF